jgi:nucleotide-binding universal stress UspA family protein
VTPPAVHPPGTAPNTTAELESAAGAAGKTTVVVGLDGSGTSWSALWWACGEAERLGGRAIAVYVTGAASSTAATAALVAGFDAGTYALAAEGREAARAAELELELTQKTADLDVEVGFIHLHGDPAEQLTRVARATRADMIAVGRSTKLRHRLAGSLGRGLTRSRRTPIVVIVP